MEKKKYIKKLSQRADIQAILVVSDKDQSRDMKFLHQNFDKDEQSVANIVNEIEEKIKKAEEDSNKSEITDQSKYLLDQKIDALKSLN